MYKGGSMSAKVIAILNSKGGVGKSTISINVAYCLQQLGYRVLLCDSDYEQESCLDWHEASGGQVLDVQAMTRETLSNDIKKHIENYDFILIDGAAKADKVIGAAIRAADVILIPFEASSMDTRAMNTLVDLIKGRQEVANGKPPAFFLVNKEVKNTTLSKEAAGITGYGFDLLDNRICWRQVYKEAADKGLTVLHLNNEKAKTEINKLTREILKHVVN